MRLLLLLYFYPFFMVLYTFLYDFRCLPRSHSSFLFIIILVWVCLFAVVGAAAAVFFLCYELSIRWSWWCAVAYDNVLFYFLFAFLPLHPPHYSNRSKIARYICCFSSNPRLWFTPYILSVSFTIAIIISHTIRRVQQSDSFTHSLSTHGKNTHTKKAIVVRW